MIHHTAYVVLADDYSDEGPWICSDAYTDEETAIAKIETFAAAQPANTYRLFQVTVSNRGMQVGRC